jgi:hypothetical protein
MGGASGTVTARTKKELESKVREWYRDAAASGLEGIRHPWDPKDAIKTDDGYKYVVSAHT